VLIEIPEEIQGPRVLLRPLGPADAPAAWQALEQSREHLAPWIPWVQDLRTLEDARTAINRSRTRWQRRQDLSVGIFNRETGRFLGGTGLHRIDWTARSFEIGYWIRQDAQRRGYVTEAVQLLVRLAFERLGATRVEIRVDPRNTRSVQVPERLGFVLERTRRESAADPTSPPAVRWIFSLLQADYARLPWGGARHTRGRGRGSRGEPPQSRAAKD